MRCMLTVTEMRCLGEKRAAERGVNRRLYGKQGSALQRGRPNYENRTVCRAHLLRF